MWYKFSEKKPSNTDIIILRQSAFCITEGYYQNETNTFFSFDEHTYDPFIPEDDNEWCISPENKKYEKEYDSKYGEFIWHNAQKIKPEEDSLIVVRFYGNRSNKYFEGIVKNDKVTSKSGKQIDFPSTSVWTYLPQKWIGPKKEFHIWLDWEGCMPKDCCATYVATKKEVDTRKEYIATTQTNFDLQELISLGYRIFVHIKTTKIEIHKESLDKSNVVDYLK